MKTLVCIGAAFYLTLPAWGSTPEFWSGGFSLSKAQICVEQQTLEVGKTYYVAGDEVNIRTTPADWLAANTASLADLKEIGKLPIQGQARRNDIVQVEEIYPAPACVVRVRVVKSSKVPPSVNPSLIGKGYLSINTTVNPLFDADARMTKYFAIQNIATERMRVYERCDERPGCPHKPIYETEIVVGRPDTKKEKNGERDETGFHTRVGHFKVKAWVKFYQDVQGHYPPWYDPGAANPVPLRDTGTLGWVMAKNDKLRGAFGWYTALLAESDLGQWIHGTFGFGKDGNKFIDYTRGTLANIVSDPQSSGCTRVENQSIAYLRQILPVGSDVFRVYAREAVSKEYTYQKKSCILGFICNTETTQRDPSRSSWNWILTNEGFQSTEAPSADAREVMNRAPMARLNLNYVEQGGNIIERGTYDFNATPTAIGFSEPFDFKGCGSFSFTGQSGNSYCIDKREMQGLYLVDKGLFIQYNHPRSKFAPVDGFDDSKRRLPEFLEARNYDLNEDVFVPKAPFEQSEEDKRAGPLNSISIR